MTIMQPMPALPSLAYRDRLRTLPDTAPSLDGQFLMLGEETGYRLLALGDEPVLIGRATHADVITFEDVTVSRRHATLERRGDDVVLHDDCSTNGTFVNGRRVARAVLTDGDVLAFGRIVVLFRDTTPAASQRSLALFP